MNLIPFPRVSLLSITLSGLSSSSTDFFLAFLAALPHAELRPPVRPEGQAVPEVIRS